MSGFADALLTGFLAALVAGAIAWLIADRLESRFAGAETALWRAARWIALAPIALAGLFYFLPAGAARPDFLPDFAPVQPVGAAEGAAMAEGLVQAAVLPWRGLVWTVLGLGLLAALAAGARRAAVWARIRRRSSAPGAGPARFYQALAEPFDGPVPALRLAEGLGTPLLTGWRAVVLAPPSLFENERTARFALTHELAHHRRGDERDRLIGAALTTLFWFHWPLRKIEERLCAARELACDRDTLAVLGGGQRKAYAEALITMMAAAPQPASAFGAAFRRQREMRIKSILAPRRAPARARAGLIAALAASLFPVAAAQAVFTDGQAPGLTGDVQAAPAAPAGVARVFSGRMGEFLDQMQDLNSQEDFRNSILVADRALVEAEDGYARAVILQMRGRSKYELDDLDGAINDWQGAMASGGMTQGEINNLRLNIAQLHIVNDRVDAGLAEFEQAFADGLEASPRHRRMLAQAYAQAGRYEEGLFHAQAWFDSVDLPGERDFELMMFFYSELGFQEAAQDLADEMRAAGFDAPDR